MPPPGHALRPNYWLGTYMAYDTHPIGQFQALVQPLIGLPISYTWKGYGSAIFIELGELTTVNRRHNAEGVSTIWVDWDWRVEVGTSVLYGSSNSRPEIKAGIDTLIGSTIQAVSLYGEVPELLVQFSNGHSLRSMVAVSGNPEWRIKLAQENYLFAEGQILLIGNEPTDVTDEEKAAFRVAEHTALRWGIPLAEPKLGNCSDCTSFIYLDGEGSLLDYGTCLSFDSLFDGKVVNCKSGCPQFSPKKETY